MSKEKSLEKELKVKLEYIANHRALLRISALEIKERLSKSVSEQHINRVISGTYRGKYNNVLVIEIINKTLEIIKEKKAALVAA
jgi:hypothetical protein